MPEPLNRGFDGYPEEAAIIGRLVVCYGELEFEFMRCLGEALDGDNTTAARVLFRARGEEQRLQIGDALMRDKYEAAKLGSKYTEAIADLGFCKTIRNRYAHSHWYADADSLTFIQWEDAARGNNGKLTIYKTALELLQAHEAYFVFCLDCLLFLNAEMRFLRNPNETHTEQWPKKIARPPPYNGPA